MGYTLKKVKPGDPLAIPAATFNTFVDAAQDFLRRQYEQAQTGTPTTPGSRPSTATRPSFAAPTTARP